eukprot:CAMPEP_0170063888 /NCGR_PEP_ID=MMETSP0019_2-20121128/4588_1 /TAXON_ID=98059 /ORGANISM="Dinobryon sp., Strain UTEXLB2267" /LENGTH=509 /DNA_ID=CAMNT_0010270433 /DNA_START=672 /DNA_END=2201 /DNA_ORIENTATION=-
MKVMQYMLGFLSIGMFFAQNGRSASSANCDAALPYPVDSATAILTTTVVIILLPPILYMFAQVLVPSFSIRGGHRTIEHTSTRRGVNRKYFCGSKQLHYGVTLLWKIMSLLFSVDWFLFKGMFNFSVGLYSLLKRFLRGIYEKNRLEYRDVTLTTMLKGELDSERELPDLPWLHAFQYFSSVNAMELEQEKLKWKNLAMHFPSYSHMVKSVYLGVTERWGKPSCSAKLIITSLSWMLPFQLLLSSIGRQYWYRVIKNYFIFCFMSLGVWTESIGSSYTIVEKFLDFESMFSTSNDSARIQLAQDEVEVEPVDDEVMIMPRNVATKDEENEDDEVLKKQEQRNMFVQFFSATASSRSVLLQLIPGLTAFAVLSVDLSVCPILVYSDPIRRLLPPLLSTDSWKSAQSQLRRNTNQSHPSSWKVFLLALYLSINDSRLIQYFIILQINCVAFGIVFYPDFIGRLVASLVVVTLIVALFRVGKYYVDVFDFFFPQFITETDDLRNMLLPVEEE